MIYIRHLGAAPDDIEKDFDAALIRTHALTLASETLREAQVDLAHVERIKGRESIVPCCRVPWIVTALTAPTFMASCARRRSRPQYQTRTLLA